MLGEDEVEDTVDLEDAWSLPVFARESVQARVREVVVVVQACDGEVCVVVCGVDQVRSSVVGVFPYCHVSAIVAEWFVVASPRVVTVYRLAGSYAYLGSTIV